MAKLEISTVIGCGLRCSICPQDVIEKAYTGPKRMTFDTFAAALANTPAGIPLSFAGYAEPYLNRECSAMIAHAAAQGRQFQVYTTGAGMNDADVELLIRLQPYTLALHLPDADGDMKLPITDDYIRRMKRLSMAKNFSAVCYGTLPDSLSWAKPWLGAFGLISRAGNVKHLPQISKRGPLKCGPDPENGNNVLIPTGELSLCCCSYDLGFILGNLVTETWEQIRNGAGLARVRELMRSGDIICRKCEYAKPA